MSKLQITPGTATVLDRTEVYGAGGGYFIGSTRGKYTPPTEQDEANATLIADALNTHNKCQTLPSELLEQRDELVKALKWTLRYWRLRLTGKGPILAEADVESMLLCEAEEALSKLSQP